MLILCPACKKQTEIEHEERGCRIECVCGSHFSLDDQTVLKEFTQIDEPPPARIGPYPIERFIGSGGMGKVYKGIHPKLGLPVAVKVLHPEYAEHAESRDRFTQSAKICAKLSHPNIVRVYDFGFAPEPYLVLEYIGGGTLLRYLHEHERIAPRRAAEIGTAVACALEEADKYGIVHRDVKPDNIMLDGEGICKLSDLGLAKIDLPLQTVREKKNYTAETKHGGLGTPEYMAPEQALDARNCDIRADIYGLGVSMYQLVTGQLPYHSHVPEELQRLRLYPPDSPRIYCPDLAENLEQIILRCMACDPANRYQTPGELRDDLEAYLSGFPLPSRTLAAEAVFAAEARLRKKMRIQILLLILFCVISLCALAWIIYFLNSDTGGTYDKSAEIELTPLESQH